MSENETGVSSGCWSNWCHYC